MWSTTYALVYIVETAVCLKCNRLPWLLLGSMHAISTMIIGEPIGGDMPL